MAVTETVIANLALRRLGDDPITDIDTDTSKRAVAAEAVYDTVRDEVLRAHPWNCVTTRAQLAPITITGVTQDNPGVVSAVNTFANGETVLITEVVGMTELNGNTYTVASASGTDFALSGTDTNGFTAYSSGGQAILKPAFEHAYAWPLPSDCLRVVEVYDSREPWVVEGNRILSDDGDTLNIRYIKLDTDPDNYDPLLVSAMAARLAHELCELLTQSNTKREQLRRDYAELLTQARRADGMEQSPTPIEVDDWILARL